MRKVGFLTFTIVLITLTILGQDTKSDAKKDLSDEWRDYPDRCMRALDTIFGASSDASNALQVLGLGLGDEVNAVYKDASSYADFWQLVVTAPMSAPPPPAPPPPPKSDKQKRDEADAACKSADGIVDDLYAHAQIPLLRKSLARQQTNPVSAVYLLLAAVPNDANWQQNLAYIRACAASDDPDPVGTKIFKYVTTKFPTQK